MSARTSPDLLPFPDDEWRTEFVEELGLLAFEMGTPRAMARVLAWMVVCEPAEQSARAIQVALKLSAGAVSSAVRMLFTLGMLERVAYPGDRRIYYRMERDAWERAIEARMRTMTRLREVADRAVAAAGPTGPERLREMRDVYAWFESQSDVIFGRQESHGR